METPEFNQIDADRIRFRIRVTAGARKPRIGGTHDGALKVAVTQIAEKGKANQAVVQSIAKQLGISKSSIEIVGGQTSRIKTIQVSGVSIADAIRRFS